MAEDIKFKGFEITEDDRTFRKEFEEGGGNFSVVVPLPYEKTAIHTAVARSLGGLARDSVGKEEYEYARMVVTLNQVIKDKPAWWKGAQSCPSDDFLYALWRWYLDVEQEFDDRVKTKTKGAVLGKT